MVELLKKHFEGSGYDVVLIPYSKGTQFSILDESGTYSNFYSHDYQEGISIQDVINDLTDFPVGFDYNTRDEAILQEYLDLVDLIMEI